MDKNLITDIVIDEIDSEDYPDFCDAYISAAKYNGIPLTDEELDELNEDDDFRYTEVMEFFLNRFG